MAVIVCLKLAAFLVFTTLLMPLVLAVLRARIVTWMQLVGTTVRLLICMTTLRDVVVTVVPRFVVAWFAGPVMYPIWGLTVSRVVMLLALLAEGFRVRMILRGLLQLDERTFDIVEVRR